MELSLRDLRDLLTDAGRGPTDFGSPWKIVVLDKGFVVVGRVSRDGAYLTITDCKCIRYWGTPADSNKDHSGLGHLAEKGPTPTTRLDKQPATRVHELQVVQMIDTSEEVWRAR